MKTYNVRTNIGKCKYAVYYYDEESKYPDGSPFYDLAVFQDKKKLKEFTDKLKAEGYKDESYMELKSYIIVDENNRWLATGMNETPEQMRNTIIEVRQRLLEENEKGTIFYTYEITGKPLTSIV